jgi:MoxR-like ATPase
MVVIEGEPGVGKSSVLRANERHARQPKIGIPKRRL